MIRQFHHRTFLPLADLVRLKEKNGTTISLVIPALNEAKTIGQIVRCARKELQQKCPLLDEIIVIDGDSSDKTGAIAAGAGATVHISSQIRPDLAYPSGKGTSLWRSLFVAKGDILVYVDADILNFHPRFIYGLAGALLKKPALDFAKAFYQRPLHVGKTTIANFGGRVTEIAVRPLLSLWYPELARIYQPLSGEYAFRKNALIQIPFSSGYGVEIRLLLAFYQLFGLGKMGQVDMGTRLHRNRTVTELGRMSCAIQLEFLKFLQEDKKIDLNQEPHSVMISPARNHWHEIGVDKARLPPVQDIQKGAAWL